MRRFSISLLCAVVSLSLLASVALADGKGKRGKSAGLCPCMIAKLGLNPEQERGLGELKLAKIRAVAPARAELTIKRAELKMLWRADKPDRKAILGKRAEMDTARRKIGEARVDFKLGLLKLLNPEQQKLVRGMWAKGGSCDCDKHGKGMKGKGMKGKGGHGEGGDKDCPFGKMKH